MKQLFISLPTDIKQTISSLAISLALICGSLFMLSAYMDTIREGAEPDQAVVATMPEEESSHEADWLLFS